jgi:hypothetical protein
MSGNPRLLKEAFDRGGHATMPEFMGKESQMEPR